MGPQRRLGRRLEAVAKAVEGGYCRLQMPLKPALGLRETVAGRPGRGGGVPPPLPMHPCLLNITWRNSCAPLGQDSATTGAAVARSTAATTTMIIPDAKKTQFSL